jgi:hypothetical protein
MKNTRSIISFCVTCFFVVMINLNTVAQTYNPPTARLPERPSPLKQKSLQEILQEQRNKGVILATESPRLSCTINPNQSKCRHKKRHRAKFKKG